MDSKPNTVAGVSAIPGPQATAKVAPLRRIWVDICDRILGGLILVMPFLITFWIIRWIYSFLEINIIDPLAMLVLWKLKWTTSSTELPYWFETFVAPLIAILLALTALYLFDYFSDTKLRRTMSWVMSRMP